jgi:putative endonuclease
MTDSRRRLGQHAEDWVAAHLRRAGYTVLARNWRWGKVGELDIVARYNTTIVFVEVRARRGSLEEAVSAALDSVNERKRARLLRLAEAYLSDHDLQDVPWHITVVAVACQDDTMTMEIIKNAIEW